MNIKVTNRPAAKIRTGTSTGKAEYRLNIDLLLNYLAIFNTENVLIAISPTANHKNEFKELQGKPLKNLFPPKIADALEKGIKAVFSTGSVFTCELTTPVNYVYKIFDLKFIPGEQGKVILLARDVTKSRRAEEALEKSELRFKSVWENSIDGMRLLDLNGNIAAANKAYASLTGLTPEEYIGKPFTSVYNSEPLKAEEILKKFRADFVSRKIRPFTESEIEFRSGRKLTVEISNIFIEPGSDNTRNESIEGEVLLLSIFRDITSRKNSEAILRNSEEKYRTLVDTSPDPIIQLDRNGDILMVNRQFCENFLVPDDEDLSGTSIKHFLVPAEVPNLKAELNFILKSKSVSNREYTFIRRNGEIVPVEINASVMFNSNTIVAVVRDITKRKESEMALKNSELRFRSVWENATDGMRLTDRDGRIVAVNRSFMNITGLKYSDLIGYRFYEIYMENSGAEKLKTYKSNFEKKYFPPFFKPGIIFSSGKTADLEISYSIMEDRRSEPLLLSIFHDVTERKKAEEDLRKSEKLAAIGRMAAYLSHEIKTPLASIKMNIDMITRDSELSTGKQKSLKIIQKEIKRLNKLLKNVLQYSRIPEIHLVNVNLGPMIKNIVELLSAQLSEKNITLVNRVENVHVNADYQKLQSVFLHLIENSVESIGNKGIIDIYAEEKDDGDSVTVYVKDSGSGVTAADQIFEPFYTTKNTGTGLGLAIAQRIIEQHQGLLRLYSSVPGETIFAITFHNYGL